MCRMRFKYGYQFWLILNKKNAVLADGFVQTIDKMDPTSTADWRELFDLYGTHYALSSLYGGNWISESYESTQTVLESTHKTKEVNFSGSGTAKGVTLSGALGLAWDDRVSNKTETASTNSFDRGSGMSGGNFESADVLEEEKYVPLKLDLRPIYDVFWAELVKGDVDEARIARYAALRKQGPAMLRSYKENYVRKAVRRDLRPRVFTFTLLDVKVDSVDDAGGDVDIYGSTSMKLMTTDPDCLACAKTAASMGSIPSVVKAKPGKVFRMPADGNSLTFSVIPSATKTGTKSNLEKVSIQVYCNYLDADGAKGGNDDDNIWGASKMISLAGLKMDDMQGKPVEKEFKPEGKGAGKLTVRYQVQEQQYQMESVPPNFLPGFPGDGDWRVPSEH